MSIFNANLKLFLKLSNFASVDEKKNFVNYQDAQYVRQKRTFAYVFFSGRDQVSQPNKTEDTIKIT